MQMRSQSVAVGMVLWEEVRKKSAVGYCAAKPTEKSPFAGYSTNIPRGLSIETCGLLLK